MIVAAVSWRSRRLRLCGSSEQRDECRGVKGGLQVKTLCETGVYKGLPRIFAQLPESDGACGSYVQRVDAVHHGNADRIVAV